MIGRPIFPTILAAVLIAAPAAAAAASQEAGRISAAASPAEMFGVAGRLISQGRYEEAKRILRLLESNPNRDVQNEARFRRATLLIKEKRPCRSCRSSAPDRGRPSRRGARQIASCKRIAGNG